MVFEWNQCQGHQIGRELEPWQDKKSGCTGLTVSTSLLQRCFGVFRCSLMYNFFLNVCNIHHGIHGKPQTDWDTQIYVNKKKAKKKKRSIGAL